MRKRALLGNVLVAIVVVFMACDPVLTVDEDFEDKRVLNSFPGLVMSRYALLNAH